MASIVKAKQAARGTVWHDHHSLIAGEGFSPGHAQASEPGRKVQFTRAASPPTSPLRQGRSGRSGEGPHETGASSASFSSPTNPGPCGPAVAPLLGTGEGRRMSPSPLVEGFDGNGRAALGRFLDRPDLGDMVAPEVQVEFGVH